MDLTSGAESRLARKKKRRKTERAFSERREEGGFEEAKASKDFEKFLRKLGRLGEISKERELN